MSSALMYFIFAGSNITFTGSTIAFPGMPSNLSIASNAIQIPSIGPTVNLPVSTAAPEIQTGRPDYIFNGNDTASPVVNPGQALPLSDHYKIVCNFVNWGSLRFLPEDIDHTLCTHIVLGFAVLDDSDLVMKPHPSWAELDNQFYARLVAYKQRGLKVLLSLGGWNDSAEDKYSRLVNSAENRQKFAEHALKFVKKYQFDGLELDWEWPVCWQTDCSAGPATDKEGFSLLVNDLSSAFKPKGLLLSAVFGQTEQYINKGYDVPVLAKYLDWISIVTYDYHGHWNTDTGHHAPLYHSNVDDVQSHYIDYAITYLISKGAPSRKIVMGMAFYGRSYTLNNPEGRVSMNVPASGRGEAGEFTKNPGFLAYYEICDRIHNHGWTVVQDPLRRVGPYAYKGNQWVGFDDADMVRRKAQYIRDMNLGGGMVKGIDIDDFKGNCGEGVHPLMHALRETLADPPNGYNACTSVTISAFGLGTLGACLRLPLKYLSRKLYRVAVL